MPQMAPILWLPLFTIFLFLLTTLMKNIFFFTQQVKNKNYDKKMKTNNKIWVL